MTASQHTIAGTVITMPVQIRKANQHMAMFSVDADAAQRLIDYSGLQVCRFLPGRTMVVLTFMHYIDGDLDQELDVRDIGAVQVQKGVVRIKRIDAEEGWFSSRGVYKFDFASLANAQLFFFLLNKLVGVRVS